MNNKISITVFFGALIKISCPRNLEKFSEVTSVLCKHFEIDALDHIVFLVDNDERIVTDETFENYRKINNEILKMNLFVSFHHQIANSSIVIPRHYSENIQTAPVLFYVTSEYFNTTRGQSFTQQLSSLDLSTHIWLFDFYSSTPCKHNIAQVQSYLQSSIVSLTLDSQVAMLTSENENCNSAILYELYKVTLYQHGISRG